MTDPKKKYAHRVGKIRLKLLDASGKPIKASEVKIVQTKYKFLFGAAAFDSVPMANGEYEGAELEAAEARFDKLFDIFNAVTLPFLLGEVRAGEGESRIRCAFCGRRSGLKATA